MKWMNEMNVENGLKFFYFSAVSIGTRATNKYQISGTVEIFHMLPNQDMVSAHLYNVATYRLMKIFQVYDWKFSIITKLMSIV